MNRETLYEAWAPPDAVWSPWAKPVLFAHYVEPGPPPSLTSADPEWAPLAAAGEAVVLDLPGAESVAVGMALARRGYRPVPLFNACPAPRENGPNAAVVDVDSILAALAHFADELVRLSLPPDAPPAFLLDADRAGASRPIEPGRFDNRSVLFATDFPSARFLAERGIQSVLVVAEPEHRMEDDLVAVLRAWHRGGLTLRLQRAGSPDPPQPYDPGREFALWSAFRRRLWAWLHLRSNLGGGYGGFVPESSAGG